MYIAVAFVAEAHFSGTLLRGNITLADGAGAGARARAEKEGR